MYEALTRTKRANERYTTVRYQMNKWTNERTNHPTNQQTGDQTEMINDAIA